MKVKTEHRDKFLTQLATESRKPGFLSSPLQHFMAYLKCKAVV